MPKTSYYPTKGSKPIQGWRRDTLEQYRREVAAIPFLDRAQEKELWRHMNAGGGEGERAYNQLVQSYLPLAIKTAMRYYKRYYGWGVPLLDLIQEGNIGLLKAAKTFDSSRGVSFLTYATRCIRREIWTNVHHLFSGISRHRVMRVNIARLSSSRSRLLLTLGRQPTDQELAAAMKISLCKLSIIERAGEKLLYLDSPLTLEEPDITLKDRLAAAGTPEPGLEIDQSSLSEYVRQALRLLPDRQREMLSLRIGLDDGKEWQLEEIGERFGVTKQAVSQLLQRAHQRLYHSRLRAIFREHMY